MRIYWFPYFRARASPTERNSFSLAGRRAMKSLRYQEEVVYEVAGTFNERAAAKTTNRAGFDIPTAVVLIFALSPLVTNVIRPLSHRAPNPAFLSNVGTNIRPEHAENSADPPYYSLSTPPAHPDAKGEIKGRVTYEGTLPKL